MIAEPYLAAALQLTSTPDLDANLEAASALIEQAARRGARLIGLPENLPQICETPDDAARQVESTYPIAMSWLSGEARRHGVTIFGGLAAPTPSGRVKNLLVVMGPDGTEVARYAKRHLFDVNFGGKDIHHESAYVEPGEDLVVADLGALGELGLSICYDVRFPEHYRGLVDRGAELLAVPSAFITVTGKDHWHVLLRARAIENTAYVIAPAQAGFHNAQRASYGHALIVDPWGTPLADAGTRPGMALAEIDPARLAEVRHGLPSLKHRRG